MGFHGVSVGDTTKSLDYEAKPPGQGFAHIDPSVDSALETLKQCDNHHCDTVGARGRTHERDLSGGLPLASLRDPLRALAQAPGPGPDDQPSRTHARIHAGLVLTRGCLGETLQINVLVDRGEDGHDENWAPTPARWPLPRHCFARIVFIARAFSHVGPLL